VRRSGRAIWGRLIWRMRGSLENSQRVSVFRFVMAALAVKILIAAGFGIYAYLTENEPPSISTSITIVAVGVALFWYSKVINRPMQRKEIILFASGVAVSDVFLSFAWLIGVIWISGQPLSLEGADAALFEGTGSLLQSDVLAGMLFVMVFATIMTFVLSAFFAWLMTRKLPKKDK